ncbi:MAG: biotin--[acetyl-CoA-carboxylase] ligase [Alphaproteobacteria bacterium]|nr:biotin--[acetyl-CoA-carboxylase] ligase [Alphaproteobacteria bacterium]
MTLAPQPRDLPTFYRHTALGEVTSTNDEAVRLAATGAEEGTLITAIRQTSGRGRRGRTWQSPEGNLYLSLILRPGDALAGAAAIGFAGVLSVADAAEGVLGAAADIALKWPNDVLIGGRKAAGMMIESTGGKGGDALILGVGINVCWHPSDLPYPATDLHAAGGREANVDDVLRAFCEHFLDRYRQWQKSGFAPLRAAWISRAKGLGEALSVDIEGRRFDGIFEGLDDDGALCLDLGASGIKKVTAGDVFFSDTPRPK